MADTKLTTLKRIVGQRVRRLSAERCAMAPLTSYRYKGSFGWIMIGANDVDDAMREAARSTDGPLSKDRLEVWNGAGAYVHA